MLTCLLPVLVWAQEPGEAPGAGDQAKLTRYADVFGGRLLPYGIYGVRDSYPYWGFRFGHTWPVFDPEWTFVSVMAKGVSFYSGSMSITFPIEWEGIRFIPFVGADAHYYHGKTNLRELPYELAFGSHVGFSPLVEINKRVFIRTDFKMNFGPGRSLLVGAGFSFYF